MFINLTDPTFPCLLCSIPNCITCFNLDKCNICDSANGYFLNPSDRLCYNSTSMIIPICGDNILSPS